MSDAATADAGVGPSEDSASLLDGLPPVGESEGAGPTFAATAEPADSSVPGLVSPDVPFEPIEPVADQTGGATAEGEMLSGGASMPVADADPTAEPVTGDESPPSPTDALIDSMPFVEGGDDEDSPNEPTWIGPPPDQAGEASVDDAPELTDVPTWISPSSNAPFPRATLRRAKMEMGKWLGALPLLVKLAGVLPIILLVLVVYAIVSASGEEENATAYLAGENMLLAGPSGEHGFAPVGALARNEPVEVFEAYGDYTLVRDGMGRVGYVTTNSLSPTELPVTADDAFRGCLQRVNEPDTTSCSARSQHQHTRCIEYCDSKGSDPQCVTQCEERHNLCTEMCGSGAMEATAPPPVAPPVAQAPTEDELGEPIVDDPEGLEDPELTDETTPEAGGDDVPVVGGDVTEIIEDPEPKRKKRRKKRRKRRRR